LRYGAQKTRQLTNYSRPFFDKPNSIKKFGPPAHEASRREVRDGLERKLARDVLTTLCRRPARTVGSVGQFIPGMK